MRGDPDRGIQLAPLIIVAVVSHSVYVFVLYIVSHSVYPFQLDVFIWPFFAVALERHMYGTATIIKPHKNVNTSYPMEPIPTNTAISIRNLTKIYSTSFWNAKGDVTAVSNLSLDIPKTGIFVILGSNGCIYLYLLLFTGV